MTSDDPTAAEWDGTPSDPALVTVLAYLPSLTDFLLARLAEDEAVALDAQAAEIHTVAHEHMERWDPARVLADVTAKRAIVGIHSAGSEEDGRCYLCDTVKEPCDTLKALAWPYADHPNFDPAWLV